MIERSEVQRRLQLYAYLENLLEGWSCWEKYRDFYLDQLLPELQASPKEGTEREEKEKELLNATRSIATPEEWRRLPQLARGFFQNWHNEGRSQHLASAIEHHLRNFKIDAADDLYLQHPGAISQYLRCRARAAALARDELEQRIASRDWQGATELLEKLQDHLSGQDCQRFRSNLQELELEHKRNQLRRQLIELLERSDFSGAERLFQSQGTLPVGEYEVMKQPYVQRFIAERFGYADDQEKAKAVVKSDQNVLVKARAGSGKTTTIACKTVWLIEKEGVHPDRILVLAFNRKAAKEISQAICSKCKHFRNARTFHSLAYQLVLPTQKPLFDNGHGDLSLKKLSLFVQRLVGRIWNPVFHAKMYAFFRKALQEIKRSGAFLSDEEYYLYRRNMPEVTLCGERVKSRGEKYIADSLFEHGIDYRYERTWQWGKRPYRPDFTIQCSGRLYVIEHWGIDELQGHETSPLRRSGFQIDKDDYLKEMERKRDFWRQEHPEVVLLTFV